MFPVISRSKYVFFVKVEGLTKLPSNNSNLYNNKIENEELNSLLLNEKPSKNFKGEKAGQDTGGGSSAKNYYICCSMLLEDQIVKALNLNKVGVYDLKDTKTDDIIKDIAIINLSSKSSAVKGGFINYWKASFKKTTEEETSDFKKEYTLSFITPSYIDKKVIEKNLINDVSIKPTANSPTYKYLRNSLDRISGRKYKN